MTFFRISLAVLAAIASAPLFADPGIISARSGLNIRERADSHSRVVATAPFKSLIEIEEITDVQERVGTQTGVWLKVTYTNPTTGNDSSGYAFDGFVFRQEDTDLFTLRENFLKRTFSIDLRREGTDDMHWKVILKLRNGQNAVLFQNNGDADKGSDDLYLADAFPEAGFIAITRKESPEVSLVDLTTGRITPMLYASIPVFNSASTAFFEFSSGGMFGTHLDIYQITGRSITKVFSIGESDFEGQEGTAVWKDPGSIECEYPSGGGKKRFTLRLQSGRWNKGPACSVNAATGRCG